MRSLFEQFTTQIIAAIEQGAAGYRMPWNAGSASVVPYNGISRRPYRGINTLLLWSQAARAGHQSSAWATYRQWQERGAQVRKGERSTPVVLWKLVERNASDQEPAATRTSVARAFHVFNADQVDGSDEILDVAPATPKQIASAEAFFACQEAMVWHGSDSAFYDARADIISMPSFQTFVSSEAYYSVLAHELAHWTGAKPRLDRELSARFGSEAYAMEELVAELSASFIAGHLALGCEPRRDHAPYIASWLKVLGDDPRAIVTAASKAQAAADYLIAFAEPRPDESAVQTGALFAGDAA